MASGVKRDVIVMFKVDNDDYVRRVLKTDDVKPPPAKSESQQDSSSSRVKVCALVLFV